MPHRFDALSALESMGAAAKDAEPAVVAALDDQGTMKIKHVRFKAAFALAAIDPGHDRVMPMLTEALGYSVAMRGEALPYLEAQGRPAVPALLQVVVGGTPLKSQDGWTQQVEQEVREEAVASLTKTLATVAGPDDAGLAPRLIEAVRSDDAGPRTAAVAALGRLGKPAASALLKGLHDKDAAVRAGCAQALGQIGPDAKEADETLFLMAKVDKAAEVRQAAFQAVQKIRARP